MDDESQRLGHIWRPRAPGWLAGWLTENPMHMHAGSPECMHASQPAILRPAHGMADTYY